MRTVGRIGLTPAAPTLSSLLVVLDGLRRPDAGRVVVVARLAQGAPLPEQVPALVERDLECLQPLTVGVARGSVRLAPPEVVLLLDELLDGAVDPCVVHRSSFGSVPRRPPTLCTCRRGPRCRATQRGRPEAAPFDSSALPGLRQVQRPGAEAVRR